MSDEICQKFAIKLKNLRLEKKMSQGELSVEAECAKSYIGMLENGQRTPSLAVIAKLSRALGVHIKELFDFEYEILRDNG